MKAALVLVLTLFGAAAQADAPLSSARPVSRVVESGVQVAPVTLMRPLARPGVSSPEPVETVSQLIADGSMTAAADLPLMSFMAASPGQIRAIAPQMAVEAATAPMGVVLATTRAVPSSVRPQPRLIPDRSFVTRAQYRADQSVTAFSPLAVPLSLRPMLRPAALTRQIEEARAAIVRGSVCGDPAIQGEAIGDLPGPGSCGIDNAVRLRSVAGVTFSGEDPRVDCGTAIALKRWIERGALPAIGNAGGGLAQISVMGTYACRNQIGSGNRRLSEHSFGKAFDVGGFRLRDGTTFTVLRDWGSRAWGETLKAMHRAACGPFGTVLGPNANAAHRNHFHFDTAGYRGGSYCR